MRRSMLSLTASRSCAGVMGVDTSEETVVRPLTCTDGRVGAVIVRDCSVRIHVPVAFSISDVRVGRPVAPESSERDPLAMFNVRELQNDIS